MAGIEASTSVSEIIQRYPELTDYLMELGLCGCDYGRESNLNWDIARVAKDRNMDVAALLAELNRKIA